MFQQGVSCWRVTEQDASVLVAIGQAHGVAIGILVVVGIDMSTMARR
jgi:hypothetical protein